MLNIHYTLKPTKVTIFYLVTYPFKARTNTTKTITDVKVLNIATL